MRPVRGILALAIIAALCGAPSLVSAAANELTSPTVSPGSGSVTTAPAATGAISRIRPAADSTTGDARAGTDELVSAVLLVGLVGVGSVAVGGALLLVVGRRREPEQAPANAAPESAAPSVARGAALRRIAREDRGQASDDPIIAALGVDDEMAARRAIRRSLREISDGDRHPARRPRER